MYYDDILDRMSREEAGEIEEVVSNSIYIRSKKKDLSAIVMLRMKTIFSLGRMFGKLEESVSKAVIRIKILIMGQFLLTFRISMDHSLAFFVNISDFNGTFSDGM